MATKFDVFGNLNDFLDKGKLRHQFLAFLNEFLYFCNIPDDEDLFEYDIDTPNSSTFKETLENSETLEDPPAKTKKSEDLVDLIDIEADEEVVPSVRNQRKRGSKANTKEPDESFDLTSNSYEISPLKKSRRAADDAEVVETFELNSEDSNGSELNNSKAGNSKVKSADDSNKAMNNYAICTRARGRPKANAPKPVKVPKTKRLTYKQALAIANAPIPVEPSYSPQAVPAEAVLQLVHRQATVTTRSCNVDLTGEVVLTDQHSSAPLFQKQAAAVKQTVVEDDDSDLDQDSVKVKVKTKTSIKAHHFRRHQRYYDLFKILAEQEKIPVSNVFLFDGDKRIHPDDTPHSTGYTISTILNCRVMETKASEFEQTAKKNQIELKFQSDKWKKPIVIKMSKMDDFKTAIEILCEKVPFKPAQISLRFDGDPVVLSETPMDLDFDGGEILDCGVKV